MDGNPDGHPDRLPNEARAAAGFVAEPRPPLGWQAPLLDLVAAVCRRWQLFLIVVTLGLGIGIARYLTIRPYFQSEAVAKLMQREKPPIDLQVTQGGMRTGPDIATRGNTGNLMLPPSVDTYTQLLRQDSVLLSIGDRFASRLGLRDDIRSAELVHAIRDVLSVSGTEEGLITVKTSAPDPALAADLANALVDEMTTASELAERGPLERQITFLRRKLESERLELAQRERALEEFTEQHGIVNLEKQTNDALTLIRETRFVRQGLVQQRLERLQAFTEDDHVARSLGRRIAELDIELEQLQKAALGGGTHGSLGVQELQLKLEGLRRRVQLASDWVATLESQLALFQLRAEQPTAAVTMLKRAIPVHRRAGPSKGGTIGSAMLIAFVLGVVIALLREQWDRTARDPYLSRRAEEIRLHARVLAPAWATKLVERRRRSARPTVASTREGVTR